jgi:hypothetical protein
MVKFEGNQAMLQQHIPFRDSKLTKVLKDSLVSPKQSILVIANINPSKDLYDDTFNTLQFCDKIKKIKPDDDGQEKPFILQRKTRPLF